MSTQYAFGRIITDGLVYSLDAADRNSYPGSGTTWINTAGTGNNSTLLSGNGGILPTYSSNNGGLITIPTASGTVPIIPRISSFNDNNILTSDSSLTVSIFVNINEATKDSTGGLVCSQRWNGESDPGGYGLSILGTTYAPFSTQIGVLLSKEVGGVKTQYDYLAPFVYVRQQFRYYSFTYNNSTRTVTTFMNGIQQNSVTNANYAWTLNTTNRLGLIGTSTQGGWDFNYAMSIGCVHIYNRPLTSAELQQNYNAIKSRFGL